LIVGSGSCSSRTSLGPYMTAARIGIDLSDQFQIGCGSSNRATVIAGVMRTNVS
jgi:hypothetical protein